MKMKLMAGSFLWLIAVAFCLVFSGAVISAEASGILTEKVTYHKGKAKLMGFLARPDDGKKHPAVVLIHEWWGLNDNIKDSARKLAKEGYIALAVDLYDGRMATESKGARKLATEVRKNPDTALKNLREAVNYLKGKSDWVIPERIGSLGYCFGGGWSYQMAKNNLGVKATVIYYGRFNLEDDLGGMKTAVQGHFGEIDRAIKVSDVNKLQQKLAGLSKKHEIHIYQNAGHAFANPSGKRYNREATEKAWPRTIAFFAKSL